MNKNSSFQEGSVMISDPYRFDCVGHSNNGNDQIIIPGVCLLSLVHTEGESHCPLTTVVKPLPAFRLAGSR